MRAFAAVAFGVLALVPATGTAAQTATVNPFVCASSGGHATIPAGSELIVRQGWAAKNRGLAQEFIEAQATTLELAGGAVYDLTGSYSAPEERPDGSWVTRTITATGLALGAGESATFHYTWNVSHRIHDGAVFEDGDFGRPLFGGPGTILDATCTVTGA